MTFGQRLREERKRLGLSQESMAKAGGLLQKQTQLKYEAGTRHPDTRYLQLISIAGADVNYILTGTRPSKVRARAALEAARVALVEAEQQLAAVRAIVEAAMNMAEGK